MALTLSESAARHVRQYLDERGHGLGIRIMAQPSECSGIAYRLVFVDEEENNDLSFECHGAKIYVDAESLVYVDGTEIDFESEGEETGFSICNPNVQSACGCGANSCS